MTGGEPWRLARIICVRGRPIRDWRGADVFAPPLKLHPNPDWSMKPFRWDVPTHFKRSRLRIHYARACIDASYCVPAVSNHFHLQRSSLSDDSSMKESRTSDQTRSSPLLRPMALILPCAGINFLLSVHFGDRWRERCALEEHLRLMYNEPRLCEINFSRKKR